MLETKGFHHSQGLDGRATVIENLRFSLSSRPLMCSKVALDKM
jgi:hypothetical protein